MLRGAIQESYRVLNQSDAPVAFDEDLLLATNKNGRVEFRKRPLYFAEPGSPAERAFREALDFVDADRPYPVLFEELDIARLAPGQTLDEELRGGEKALEAASLQSAILNGLGPYLLAVVIAKAEEPGHADLVRRRLRDRFEVRTASEMEVVLTLRAQPTLRGSFKCQRFHLQRRLVELPGAIKETHYTLYVIGRPETALSELDGDALGEVLAPVYWEGSRDEHRALFPRVVSRFQACGGDAEEMSRFLLEVLNVSVHALDDARDGSVVAPLPLPPAARIISGADRLVDVDSALEKQKVSLSRRVVEIFGQFNKRTIPPESKCCLSR